MKMKLIKIISTLLVAVIILAAVQRLLMPKYMSDIILASMRDDESFIEYVFPILRYHERWNQLTSDDFKYFRKFLTISIGEIPVPQTEKRVTRL